MASDSSPAITTSSGAVRFVDEAAMRRGMEAVSEFRTVSIGLPIRHGKGPVAPMRQFPQHYLRRDGADYVAGCAKETGGFGFSDDTLIVGTHGTSHVDALCHVFNDGKMFGGLPANLVGSSGAKALGAETIPPLVTRAIVVDMVPADRKCLDPGEPVKADDLIAKIRSAGLVPAPGDALIVRTGWVEENRDSEKHGFATPGLSEDCIDWIKREKFSIIGADNIAVEVLPSNTPGVALPLHTELLAGCGVLFLELMDLQDVKGVVDQALFTLNPLKIMGGTASPVSPMLLF